MNSGLWDYEAVIIGGGPGGAASAAALSQAGHRVLLVEQTTFPRFHIGESQLPRSNEILRRIGAHDAVAAAGFVQKWGASFSNFDGSREQYADFSRAVETPEPQTFQVPRADFDKLLLDNATRLGASVLQGVRAERVTFDSGGVSVVYEEPNGKRHTARSAVVVDASGRNGFLAKRFGTRVFDSTLRNVTVHAQYRGIPRLAGRRFGDIRLVTRPDGGWFWFIPLSADITSVGLVIPQAEYVASGSTSPIESLDRYLSSTPAAVALTRQAERMSTPCFEAGFSYLASQHAGDRWLLVGDAGSFLDPIFSTGVLLALQGGVEAADAISTGLRTGDLSRRCFRHFEAGIRRRYRYFRRFAVGFYDPAFREMFFSSGSRFGIYEAVLSVLAGNWRPSLLTRLRTVAFLGLVAVQQRVRLVPPESVA